MSVYVDELRPVGYVRTGVFGCRVKEACHLMADTDNELEAFRKKLKLRMGWKHGDHYDLTRSKRIDAIRFGAEGVTSRKLITLRQSKSKKNLTHDHQANAAGGRCNNCGKPKEAITMAKKKTSTKDKPARRPAAKKKKIPPPKEAEPAKKVNDPIGNFSQEELQEFQTKCENLAYNIRKRAAEMVAAKAEAKYATESYNNATEKLTSYISGFKELPLLAKPEDSKVKKPTKAA